MKSRFTPQRGLELIYVGRLLYLGVLALVWFLALSNQFANAQVVSGSMVGNVTDAAGGSVSGASVKITLTTANHRRAVLTDGNGAYTRSTVTPRSYRG